MSLQVVEEISVMLWTVSCAIVGTETLINLLVKLKLLVGEKQVGAVQLSDTI